MVQRQNNSNTSPVFYQWQHISSNFQKGSKDAFDFPCKYHSLQKRILWETSKPWCAHDWLMRFHTKTMKSMNMMNCKRICCCPENPKSHLDRFWHSWCHENSQKHWNAIVLNRTFTFLHYPIAPWSFPTSPNNHNMAWSHEHLSRRWFNNEVNIG